MVVLLFPRPSCRNVLIVVLILTRGAGLLKKTWICSKEKIRFILFALFLFVVICVVICVYISSTHQIE